MGQKAPGLEPGDAWPFRLAEFPPSRQNRAVWTHRWCARRANTHADPLLSRSRYWTTPCGCAAHCTTSRWSSAARGGTADRGQGRAATQAQQEAELPDLKAAFPEYAALHSQVVQDVLTRLDRALQAFFRRVQAGETPGYPRFQGAQRSHSRTDTQCGNGATLDHGVLVLSNIGRLAVRWSRPLEGAPKTVTLAKEADGW